VPEPLLRAVLDTNVLVSGLLAQRASRATRPLECLRLAVRGAFRLVTSLPLIAELARALRYPKLRIPPDAAHAFTGWVVSLAEPDGVVRIGGRLAILKRDPSDNAVLETALLGRAAYLVTGNLRHFDELRGADPDRQLRGLRIVDPRQFVESLGAPAPKRLVTDGLAGQAD